MTTQFNISSAVRATPKDDDGTVLINLQSGKVFSLNGVGASIWTMMEQGISFDGIVDSLARQYEMSHQEIRDDLTLFLRVLEQKGLVQATKTASRDETEEPIDGFAA